VVALMQEIYKPNRSTSYIGLRVPEELHRFFKLFAEIQNTTITEVLVQGGLKLADEFLKDYEGPVPEEWFDLLPEYFGKKK
jgi:hypothetical protein